jgi:hypothetical protein
VALLLVSVLLGGARGAAGDEPVNACGCSSDTAGSCFCTKAAHCGCPGQCEPKGCEERRARQLEKEIKAETKRAADADRKRNSVGNPGEHRGGDRPADSPRKGVVTTGQEAAGTAPPSSQPAFARRLTAAQKRELARLLEAYLAERPEARGRTVGEIRGELE